MMPYLIPALYAIPTLIQTVFYVLGCIALILYIKKNR